MKHTRILFANTSPQLQRICNVAGYMRADAWRRFGGLATHGKSLRNPSKTNAIRKQATTLWDALPINGTIRAETTKDIINDIFLYRASAEEKVRKAIYARTNDEQERKRLYALLGNGLWTQDNFLHRQMRKHFKHGKSDCANQFVVRSDRYTTEIKNDLLIITIKNGEQPLILTTTSSGKNVNLKGNLRIICRNNQTEIHYTADKPKGRDHGKKEIGVDKGYTETFADSDGDFYGIGFNKIMTAYSDTVAKQNKQRNKLHTLEKRHREAGRLAKADAILENNLGRIKLNARKEQAQKKIANLTSKSVHKLCDKAKTIVAEDLSKPFARNDERGKKYNRRMSMWAKGVLQERLEQICKQRGVRLILVNGAYTSQMDSQTRRLEGRRVGDKFYCVSGDVLSADTNGARNVLHRKDDKGISLYTPYKEVKSILLARFPTELTVSRHQLGASVNDVQINPMTNFE